VNHQRPHTRKHRQGTSKDQASQPCVPPYSQRRRQVAAPVGKRRCQWRGRRGLPTIAMPARRRRRRWAPPRGGGASTRTAGRTRVLELLGQPNAVGNRRKSKWPSVEIAPPRFRTAAHRRRPFCAPRLPAQTPWPPSRRAPPAAAAPVPWRPARRARRHGRTAARVSAGQPPPQWPAASPVTPPPTRRAPPGGRRGGAPPPPPWRRPPPRPRRCATPSSAPA